MMIEQVKAAYTSYRWAKSVAFVILIICAALLYWFSGGFPPWAWRFLLQVIPQLPSLWAAQGSGIIAPLAGLLLLSVSLLIMWVILTIAAIKVGLHWWHDFHSSQHFAMDLREAEYLAELQLNKSEQASHLHSTHSSQLQEEGARHQRMAREERTAYAARNARVVRIPMRAAVPDYQPPVERQTTRRVARATSSSTARNQLRLIQPEEEEIFYDMQQEPPVLSSDLDIDQIATVPERASDDEYCDRETLPGLEDESESDIVESDEQISNELDGEDTLPAIAAVNASLPRSQAVRLVVGVGLDSGIVRRDAPNEDTLLAIQGSRTTDAGTEPIGLFVVADGLGGHAHGQEASRLAVHAVSEAVSPVLARGIDEDDNFLELFREGVHRANLTIYRRNRQQQEMMGTTLTGALVVNTTAYVVNVGDSRTYLYRADEGLVPITRDHSMVARLVEGGMIMRDEVYTHPNRNQIYRCLGDHATVEIDAFEVELHPGNVLLLCSDGLWEMVRDGEIERIIKTSLPHPSRISARLVESALRNGGVDNISVVVVYLAPADS